MRRVGLVGQKRLISVAARREEKKARFREYSVRGEIDQLVLSPGMALHQARAKKNSVVGRGVW